MFYSIQSHAGVKKTCVHWSVMSSVIRDDAFYYNKAHISRVCCLKPKYTKVCPVINVSTYYLCLFINH